MWLEYLLLRARPLRWKRDREYWKNFYKYIRALSIASSCWWIKRKRGEREREREREKVEREKVEREKVEREKVEREKEIDDRSAALRKRVAKMRRLVCGNMRVS